MKAIVVDKNSVDGIDFNLQKKIFEENGIEFVVKDCSKDEDEIIKECKDADVLLVIYRNMTPRIMDACPNLKILVRYGIGYDVIDVEAATQRGIKVVNSPRHCLDEVATHTIAMLLAIERKLIIYNDRVKNGDWRVNGGYEMHRLSSQTLGFVGFGNIARRAADFAKGFGFEMLAYDPYLPDEAFREKGVERVTLDELYKRADVISVHTPLAKETYHLIDKDSIAKMKKGVMIVNTSRGAIICENDLLDAVKSGKIRAAALDVIESEPITQKNHPAFETGNIILSPHAAYNSKEAEAEMLTVLANSCVTILNGGTVPNIVNKKELGL